MRRREWLRVFACIGLGILLSACNSLQSMMPESKKIDYKSSGRLPTLEVPPDLTRPTTDDRFAVPDPKGTTTFSEYNRDRSTQQQRATVAGPATVLPPQDNVRVVREGNQRWLVVSGTPDQVWPVVKDFWQEVGFIVNVEMPEAGVMETDWNENRARISDPGLLRGLFGKLLDSVYATSERDKFRTRLERGAEPNTTEIYISHRGMEEVYISAQQDNTKWQPRPADPELEAEMLRRLMTRFGVQEARAKAQVATAADKTPPRATISKSSSAQGTLTLDEQFDRAWRRVGLALDRVGFTVEDRDRSKGLYFVRYIDPQIDNAQPQKSEGFLSKLKFWGSSDPKSKKTEQYRIQVKEIGSGAQVYVLNKDGLEENTETSRRILSLLHEQLK